MMAFYYPHLLWPLVLLSFIWVSYYVYSEKNFFSFVTLYWDKKASFKRRVSTFLYLVSIILFFAFFLRPIRISNIEKENGKPLTIFLLDQSLSMGATDISPSRYEKGLEWMTSFLIQQQEWKGAIWGIRDRPFALTAITEDKFYLSKYLEVLKAKKELGGGSRLDYALVEVVNTLSKTIPSWERVNLIFITDGEQHDKRFIKKLGHPSLTISFVYVGSEKGGNLIESYQGQKIFSRPSFQFHEAWRDEGHFVYAVSALDPHSPKELNRILKESSAFFITTPIEAEYGRNIIVMALVFFSLALLLRHRNTYVALMFFIIFFSVSPLVAKSEKKLWENWKEGNISKEERFEYLDYIQKNNPLMAIIGYEELFSKNGLYEKESNTHLFNYGTLLWEVNRFESGEKIYSLIRNRLKKTDTSLGERLEFEDAMRKNRFYAVSEFMRRQDVMKGDEKKGNENLQTIFKNKKKSFYFKWFEDDQMMLLRRKSTIDIVTKDHSSKGDKPW